MLGAVFCFAIGFLQTVILSIVLKTALAGNFNKTLLFLLLKLLLYGVGFAVLYFVFLDSIFYCAGGFIAGVIFSVLAVAVNGRVNKNKEGDDVNGQGGAN